MEKTAVTPLTSTWTIYYKWLLPVIWIGLFSGGTILAIAGLFDEPVPLWICCLLVIVTVVGSYFLVLWSYRLKKIKLTDTHLWVYGVFRKDTIPLTDIETIEKNTDFSPYRIKVRFSRNTVFGREVWFIPRFWKMEMVFKSLKEAIKPRAAFDFQERENPPMITCWRCAGTKMLMTTTTGSHANTCPTCNGTGLVPLLPGENQSSTQG
jgi:hypothetical protein